jgi:hypothetical protein
MGWVKLDDGFFRNPKVLQVGRDAKLLYLAGLCYSGSALTDGFIPGNAPKVLAADSEIGSPRKSVQELVAAGLWEDTEGGYLIHDYLLHNSSAEHVRAKRDAARERMQRNRSQDVRANDQRSSRNVREPDTETETETERVGVPPTPPAREKPPARIDYAPDFESWWQVYPSGHGVKKAAYEHWKRIKPDAALVQVMIDAVHGWMRSDRWKRGYVMDAERWLRDRAWESVPPPQSAAAVGFPARTAPNGQRNLTDAELDDIIHGRTG